MPSGAEIVEVRVTDGGAEHRAGDPPAWTPTRPTVGGLAIVDALADRWGFDRDGLGQSVWAEVSLPAQAR